MKGGANVETALTMEFPRCALAGFGVNEDTMCLVSNLKLKGP